MKLDDKKRLKRIQEQERSLLSEQNSPLSKERDRFLQDEQKKLKQPKDSLLKVRRRRQPENGLFRQTLREHFDPDGQSRNHLPGWPTGPGINAADGAPGHSL